MNFASKLSFLWLVHPLCSLGYRFVPSTGRHSSLPPSPSGREENLCGGGGTALPTKKLHPTPRNSRPNTTRQASPPHEMRPNGRISGGVGGLVPPQKTPPNPRNSRPNTTRQASPPHEMRPNGRISGGVGGLVPPQKTRRGGAGPPTKKRPQTHAPPHTQKVPRTNHIRTHV